MVRVHPLSYGNVGAPFGVVSKNATRLPVHPVVRTLGREVGLTRVAELKTHRKIVTVGGHEKNGISSRPRGLWKNDSDLDSYRDVALVRFDGSFLQQTNFEYILVLGRVGRDLEFEILNGSLAIECGVLIEPIRGHEPVIEKRHAVEQNSVRAKRG